MDDHCDQVEWDDQYHGELGEWANQGDWGDQGDCGDQDSKDG